MTIMYDGINADAAAIHAHAPTAPVACYINGIFAWSPAQEAMFGRKVRISVEPGQPSAAKFARVLDIERHAAGPADAAPFLKARVAAGHKDGTIYASLATVPAVIADVVPPRWWLAWYWGRPGAPSKTQVLDELHRLVGVHLEPASVWACQYVSHSQWDESIVYGPEDWSR